ncbi:MAG: hypothetical protein AB1295_00160 [Candidatus Micrarchaeota archaeon]
MTDMKVGRRGPVGLREHGRQSAGDMKKKAGRGPFFSEVLEEMLRGRQGVPEELPVVLTTTPFGWRLSRDYGLFTISCSENDLCLWKESRSAGRVNADPDEAARFKRDVLAVTDKNPVIASIAASCEIFKG